VLRDRGDAAGMTGWARRHGWQAGDGTAPADAALAGLVATAPVPTTRRHHPAGVVRGHAGDLALVAFDVAYTDGRTTVPEHAVTAARVDVPALLLSPARFRRRARGLRRVPGGDAALDTRWVLLAGPGDEADGPAVRRLLTDATVRDLLLGSDDGDEVWSAAGHLAAVRPDGHRPALVEHHARLLTAMAAALAGAASPGR
jgi:hypothetical protein